MHRLRYPVQASPCYQSLIEVDRLRAYQTQATCEIQDWTSWFGRDMWA